MLIMKASTPIPISSLRSVREPADTDMDGTKHRGTVTGPASCNSHRAALSTHPAKFHSLSSWHPTLSFTSLHAPSSCMPFGKGCCPQAYKPFHFRVVGGPRAHMHEEQKNGHIITTLTTKKRLVWNYRTIRPA